MKVCSAASALGRRTEWLLSATGRAIRERVLPMSFLVVDAELVVAEKAGITDSISVCEREATDEIKVSGLTMREQAS